jgi:hypothetical protein
MQETAEKIKEREVTTSDSPPNVDLARKIGFRERIERLTEAITFAEAGQPEIARQILDIKPTLAGKVYGDIVYWGTVAAAIVALLGQVVTFVTRAHYMDPGYILSAIWQSQSVEQIWQGATGSLPQGHWYLDQLLTGNGLGEAGLALGVFIVIPAMLASSYILYRQRSVFFGTLAAVAAVITIASMVGLLPLPMA